MKKIMLGFLTLALVLSSQGAMVQHKLESWYIYFGLGYANPKYPDELDVTLNELADLPGVTHVSLSLDLLGLYWPLGRHTIIGGVINAFGDRYEVENTSVDLQLTGFSFAFSAKHFLNDQIGKGLFLRGDAGPARFVIDVGAGGSSISEQSDWGFGVLVGGGYGIPVSDGTRIILNVNYGFRRVQGEGVGVLAISVGGLF